MVLRPHIVRSRQIDLKTALPFRRVSTTTPSIRSKICTRPALACFNTTSIMSTVKPSHLTSSWIALNPVLLPAILKSIFPRKSSISAMSVRSSEFEGVATPELGSVMQIPRR